MKAEKGLLLGDESMDTTHGEYLALQQTLLNGETDFLSGFEALVAHTKEHFAQEERWMEEGSFSGRSEHKEEHRKILGEMEGFLNKARNGRLPFARAFVREYLPEKIAHHIRNIDSELAAWRRHQQ